MSLAGTWHIKQQWGDGNGPPMPQRDESSAAGGGPSDSAEYTIKVEFEPNGRAKAYGFLFYGTWTESDGGVAFALTDFVGQTLTLYQGKADVSGGFGGTAQGLTHIVGGVHHGSWTATRDA